MDVRGGATQRQGEDGKDERGGGEGGAMATTGAWRGWEVGAEQRLRRRVVMIF